MSFEWSEVTHTRQVGSSLIRLRIAAPKGHMPHFTTPGQYTQLKVGGAMGYFAIASEPDSGELDFLVKRGSPAAEALARCQQGDMVEVGPISGKGFPLATAANRDLVLVATGTGSAPMRSVLEVLRHQRTMVRQVVFVHGVRHPDEVGWVEDRGTWNQAGFDWRVVVSHPTPSWSGRVGRVQQHLDGLGHRAATAFLCGQKPMVAEVTKLLVAQGLPEELVLLNL